MWPRLRALVLLLLAGLAPACSTDTVVVSPTSFFAAYTPSVLNYAATHGGVLVELLGNPFDAPKEDLEAAVTAAMTGSHFGPRVDFVTEAPEDFVSPYRVVLLFDAAPHHTAIKLCKTDPELFEATSGEPVRVHAALCAKRKPLTAVSGRVSAPGGPGDPRFRALIGQITVNLFPPFNPDRQDSGRFFFAPL